MKIRDVEKLKTLDTEIRILTQITFELWVMMRKNILKLRGRKHEFKRSCEQT